MGVIQRQSIKNTIVNLAGTVIGILSILFIVPLEKEIYGYAQWLYSTALVLTPIIGLGLPTLIIKYFPEFQNRGREANFLSFSLIVGLILVVITSLILFIIYPILLSIGANFDLQTEKLQINGLYIFALSVLLFFISCLISYTSTRKRIVIPDLINNVGFKIALPVFILMYYYDWIDERWMALLLIFFFLLNFIILLFYSISLSKVSLHPKLNLLKELGIRKFTSYLGFSSLNAISYYLVFRLDIIMIGLMIDDYAVGVYAIVMVMANVMDIPTKAIIKIASPIISSSWLKKDFDNIKNIYNQSAFYLALIGQIIFLAIFFGLKDLLVLLPGDRIGDEAFIVFVFLGLGKLVDMFTSLNTHIIMYSNKYKYNLYFLSFQAILNLVLNYFLITAYGIVGAAIATFISLVLYNILKYIYILSVFKIGFYSEKLIKIIITGVLILSIYFILPDFSSPLLNLFYKSGSAIIIYAFAVFFFVADNEMRQNFRNFISWKI